MPVNWVSFTRNYDWRPPEEPRIVIAFKTGMRVPVRRKCADDAVAAGAAERIERPEKVRPSW